ncbi:MAG TPA: serine hydrolase domain-containing protein [Pyrinomonadaceae bacterium]|nr:serine hydrolase domain-containing protein [Pyrinomonadaceae bacterium]
MTDDELVGVWKAKLRFGPDARGPLTVQKSEGKYIADMLGRRLPARFEKGELSFDLPGGEGAFRGRLSRQGSFRGYWFTPKGVYASSFVELNRDGLNRWTGQVRPHDDTLTFYLVVTKRADGSLGAWLRNPERNVGIQLGVDHLVRDGAALKLMATTAGTKEEREISNGNYDAENKVINLNLRGTAFEFSREGDDSDFYPRSKNPGHYTYSPPLARHDGWPTGTLDEVNIDRKGIEKFIQVILDMPMESVKTPVVEGVLIARHGKLVLEEYFHGVHRDTLHDTRSASKSVAATIIGAALYDGAPLKLTDPVYQVMNGGTFPADLDPLKKAMTLEHLITMSSGFFCDDGNINAPGREDTMQGQREEPDYYRYTLKVPMATRPGDKAVYCSANPNLALGVLSRATGEHPIYTFDRLLAQPMQINSYFWPLDPAGHIYGGGGARFTLRDFSKFGQLMLNGGTWQGRRILSREFVTRASSRIYHLSSIYYGYLWWNMDFPYKNRMVKGFYAGGNGGQGILVIPELDLVIGTFGGNYNDFKGTIAVQQELVPKYVLPAVREIGDDKNAPIQERDFVSPYGRSPNTGPVGSPIR